MKIKIVSSMPGGSTSFFRSIAPFAALRKIDKNIEVEYLTAVDWFLISDADMLYLERPADDQFLAAVLLAKNYGVPVWVDYDDNLFEVPEDHPHSETFQNIKLRNNIKTILELADVVTVTTQDLKKSFSSFREDITVIENAFNDYKYSMPDEVSHNAIISWRGSDTHKPDLLKYRNAIWELAKKHELETAWLFLGAPCAYITNGLPPKNFRHEGALPLVPYYRYIKDTKPAIQMVPLVDNVFNRCKSNIGWLDGMIGGSVCVAPDFPEWQKPGIFRFTDPETFKKAIESAMDTSLRAAAYTLSKQYILENLLLSKINLKRVEIINNGKW